MQADRMMMMGLFKRRNGTEAVQPMPALPILNSHDAGLREKLNLEIRRCPVCGYSIANPMNDRCPRCFTTVPLSEHTNCGECSHQGNCTYADHRH